ncbi:MAG: hypothetical protein M0C28_43475 [Candidatus Moduliflexus flocculans]|nr:hypothetical protein [Candidatus Moduliflexus flocculans]
MLRGLRRCSRTPSSSRTPSTTSTGYSAAGQAAAACSAPDPGLYARRGAAAIKRGVHPGQAQSAEGPARSIVQMKFTVAERGRRGVRQAPGRGSSASLDQLESIYA